MLRIRFFRIGKKHQPFFRIVVTERTNPPQGGRFVEILGFWNPLTKEKKINRERAEYWLKTGAEPSDAVYNLFVREGIVKGKKRNVIAVKKRKEEVSRAEEQEQKEKKEKELSADSQPGNQADEEKEEMKTEGKEEKTAETKT